MILKTLMREHFDVISATESARIAEVADLMRDRRVGSVVIVDEAECVVGIITDRDIAMGLALGVATPDSFVTEVMSQTVETIPDSLTLFDVTRLFRTLDVKRLPVVDENKKLVGIVSVDDVIALLTREMFDTCTSLEPKLGYPV